MRHRRRRVDARGGQTTAATTTVRLAMVVMVAVAVTVAADAGTGADASNAVCEHTVQGQLLLADSNGFVCPVEEMDSMTGCCKRGSGPHTCTGCDSDSKCCILYETCVSCCLKPENNAEERVKKAFRVRNRPETGKFETPFQFCEAMCRTTKDCTLHENGYRSDFKFCFSDNGVPPSIFPREPLPNKHVEVVASLAGETCTDACKEKKLNCSHRLLEQINTCEELQQVRAAENVPPRGRERLSTQAYSRALWTLPADALAAHFLAFLRTHFHRRHFTVHPAARRVPSPTCRASTRCVPRTRLLPTPCLPATVTIAAAAIARAHTPLTCTLIRAQAGSAATDRNSLLPPSPSRARIDTACRRRKSATQCTT